MTYVRPTETVVQTIYLHVNLMVIVLTAHTTTKRAHIITIIHANYFCYMQHKYFALKVLIHSTQYKHDGASGTNPILA